MPETYGNVPQVELMKLNIILSRGKVITTQMRNMEGSHSNRDLADHQFKTFITIQVFQLACYLQTLMLITIEPFIKAGQAES